MMMKRKILMAIFREGTDDSLDWAGYLVYWTLLAVPLASTHSKLVELPTFPQL